MVLIAGLRVHIRYVCLLALSFRHKAYHAAFSRRCLEVRMSTAWSESATGLRLLTRSLSNMVSILRQRMVVAVQMDREQYVAEIATQTRDA